MADPEHTIQVSYDLKDLLAEIKNEQAKGFSRVETAMLAKADKTDIAELRGISQEHTRRLDALEEDRRLREERAKVHQARDQADVERVKARWSTRERLLLVLTSCAIAGGSVAAVIH